MNTVSRRKLLKTTMIGLIGASLPLSVKATPDEDMLSHWEKVWGLPSGYMSDFSDGGEKRNHIERNAEV